MSNELSLTVNADDLARVESIATQCSFEVLSNQGHFIRAFQMAAGIRMLREAITPQMMREIMSLQGSSLGFRTDKDKDGGYPPDVVKECAIEAALRGAHWVGNEFNIIAARSYLTKEYFTRKLREFPGLTDLKLYPGVPQMREGGALVPYVVTWNLNGKPDKIERTLHKIDGGTEVDERICVRVNSGMGADAVLGKAERKIKAAIYSRLTGSDVTDGEAEEGEGSSAPKGLDDLTKRIEGTAKPANGNGSTSAPTTPPAEQATGIDDAQTGFNACDTLVAVGKWEAELLKRNLTEAQKTAVGGMAQQTREFLRTQKGGKTQKELAGT